MVVIHLLDLVIPLLHLVTLLLDLVIHRQHQVSLLLHLVIHRQHLVFLLLEGFPRHNLVSQVVVVRNVLIWWLKVHVWGSWRGVPNPSSQPNFDWNMYAIWTNVSVSGRAVQKKEAKDRNYYVSKKVGVQSSITWCKEFISHTTHKGEYYTTVNKQILSCLYVLVSWPLKL